jgi:hypothetical protein
VALEMQLIILQGMMGSLAIVLTSCGLVVFLLMRKSHLPHIHARIEANCMGRLSIIIFENIYSSIIF